MRNLALRSTSLFDHLRLSTAANQLGLADAVPAHIVVHTDARIRRIKLGKLTAPSRLYWAGRPASCWPYIGCAIYRQPTQTRILNRPQSIISDPVHGTAIRQDLAAGIHTLLYMDAGSCPRLVGQRHSSNGASKIPIPSR